MMVQILVISNKNQNASVLSICWFIQNMFNECVPVYAKASEAGFRVSWPGFNPRLHTYYLFDPRKVVNLPTPNFLFYTMGTFVLPNSGIFSVQKYDFFLM